MEHLPEVAALFQPMREKVMALENAMRALPQVELETKHYFVDGMYARKLARPAHTLIVGKVHKKEHLYIVLKGSIRVTVGEEIKTHYAGDVIVSQPGTKRAVYALEDSICMTVHRTNKKSLKKIEQELIEEDTQALFDSSNKLKEQKCLG